jgi:hypothetical protein
MTRSTNVWFECLETFNFESTDDSLSSCIILFYIKCFGVKHDMKKVSHDYIVLMKINII